MHSFKMEANKKKAAKIKIYLQLNSKYFKYISKYILNRNIRYNLSIVQTNLRRKKNVRGHKYIL